MAAVLNSGVFSISIRRERCAVGVEGVGWGGVEGLGCFLEKIIFVPTMISLDAFLRRF